MNLGFGREYGTRPIIRMAVCRSVYLLCGYRISTFLPHELSYRAHETSGWRISACHQRNEYRNTSKKDCLCTWRWPPDQDKNPDIGCQNSLQLAIVACKPPINVQRKLVDWFDEKKSCLTSAPTEMQPMWVVSAESDNLSLLKNQVLEASDRKHW